MHPIDQHRQLSRRHFLTTAAGGIGGTALASMLAQDQALGSEFANPMAAKLSHFAPKAKSCIFFFMAGAPSQLDLFDPKPKLNELDGKKMDGALLEGKRFAFIKKESAVLMGSGRKFEQHGQSVFEQVQTDRPTDRQTGRETGEFGRKRRAHTDSLSVCPSVCLSVCLSKFKLTTTHC